MYFYILDINLLDILQIFVISIWKIWPILLFVFDQYENLPVTHSGHDVQSLSRVQLFATP